MIVIVAVEKAQVDHALNAQLDNGFAIFDNRLLAAVKLVVDAIKVGIVFDGGCPAFGLNGALLPLSGGADEQAMGKPEARRHNKRRRIKFLYENQLKIKISYDSIKTRSDILSAQTALQ